MCEGALLTSNALFLNAVDKQPHVKRCNYCGKRIKNGRVPFLVYILAHNLSRRRKVNLQEHGKRKLYAQDRLRYDKPLERIVDKSFYK